ncbi:aldehyde dehydrogenase family protein, partial [archaeon]
MCFPLCQSTKDAASEFDRTLQFVAALIAEFRALDQQSLVWRSLEGIYAIVRRAARGIVLCVGPFNYPLNETYATLIPALLMGNVVLLKVPTVGGLAHVLTMRAFLDALPPGTLQFVTGSGRRLLGPLMRSGAVDALAFIGTSKAADELIKAHPKVHRLKVFAQLEGKNMAVVHHDLLASPAALLSPASLLEEAMDQLVVGALSFNGQRCTAVKMIFVHEDLVDAVLQGLE